MVVCRISCRAYFLLVKIQTWFEFKMICKLENSLENRKWILFSNRPWARSPLQPNRLDPPPPNFLGPFPLAHHHIMRPSLPLPSPSWHGEETKPRLAAARAAPSHHIAWTTCPRWRHHAGPHMERHMPNLDYSPRACKENRSRIKEEFIPNSNQHGNHP
jgi:hypothetical protein